MNRFQCAKCGCGDDWATSDGGYLAKYLLATAPKDVTDSYRKVLGLKPSESFGCYCYVCNPMWIQPCTCGTVPHKAGYGCSHYGVGANPHPRHWHYKFPRMFYPKGSIYTDNHGNLTGPGLRYPSDIELDSCVGEWPGSARV
jgi:hypothetical protein